MLKINSSGWGSSDTSAPRSRKALRRAIAATAVMSVAAAGIVVGGGGGASAATAPLAQSRGNFLDGTLGTSPLQTLLKLKDAAAFAPGTQSVQNPLEATVLNSLTLPLTGALQLPQLLGINLGAANQVAVAHTDGFSYGASGAVANSGGAAVGGDSTAYPANATVNLTAAGIAGNTAVPIPGGGSADALGGVTLSLGAVRALAQTPTGGTPPTTTYQIATLTLNAGSPLLGGIIGSVGSAIGTLVSTLTGALPAGTALPSGCALTSGTLPTVSLDSGAVVLDPKTGGLTVDLEKLLETAGLTLNTLPANTDLIDFLVNYLTSPTGLAAGVEGIINGITNSLTAQFTACTAAINAIPGIGPVLVTVIQTLTGGQATLESTINGILAPLGNAAGPSPLAPLATVLKKLVDIGINVQPNGPAGPAGKAYTDVLTASANQTVPPVAGQTVVRAIEINLLSNALNVALANAAAGPSSAAPVTPTTTAPPSTPNTKIPTGVPAGGGSPGGSPTLPLALLAAGLMLASGGAVAFKLRGKHSA